MLIKFQIKIKEKPIGRILSGLHARQEGFIICPISQVLCSESLIALPCLHSTCSLQSAFSAQNNWIIAVVVHGREIRVWAIIPVFQVGNRIAWYHTVCLAGPLPAQPRCLSPTLSWQAFSPCIAWVSFSDFRPSSLRGCCGDLGRTALTGNGCRKEEAAVVLHPKNWILAPPVCSQTDSGS